MGRQINFFLAEQDQEWFDSVLREVAPFVVLEGRSPAPVPITRPATLIERMGAEPLTVFLAETSDVRLSPIRDRAEYSVDSQSEPVIEFSRCYCTASAIGRGRLYYVQKCWKDDGALVSKPETFIRWGQQLFRRVRTRLQRFDQFFYAGPEAIRAAARGVELKCL
jgi:hypothetical protein